MKPLETLIAARAPEPVAMPWTADGSRAFCESAAPDADRDRSASPGLLPRGGETFDWRVVRARLLEREARDLEVAKGVACPVEKERRLARADVWNTAAQEVEAEAKRKGLA